MDLDRAVRVPSRSCGGCALLAGGLRLLGLPAVLVLAEPPVAGQRDPVTRETAVGEEVAAQPEYEACFAVHERLHVARRELERLDRRDQAVTALTGASGAVQVGQLDVAGAAELLLLGLVLDLDEHLGVRARGQLLDRGADGFSALSSPTSRCQAADSSGA